MAIRLAGWSYFWCEIFLGWLATRRGHKRTALARGPGRPAEEIDRYRTSTEWHQRVNGAWTLAFRPQCAYLDLETMTSLTQPRPKVL